jgi:hypothetical protein
MTIPPFPPLRPPVAETPNMMKDEIMDIVISREAAIEALKRLNLGILDSVIAGCIIGIEEFESEYQLAKAIQELWDACPEKRPVDKRLVAMRYALIKWFTNDEFNKEIEDGDHDFSVQEMLVAFDAKVAELGG